MRTGPWPPNPVFGNAKPLSPSEAKEAQIAQLPDVVINAANQLIARNGSSSYFHIGKDELIDLIMTLKGPVALERQELFDKKWLDIEPPYRARGWQVEYESPDRGDRHNGYWVFSTKRV